MSLTLEQKQAIVLEVATIAAEAPSSIAAEYSGLSVAELSKLRNSARDAGVFLKVVRNTLASRALEGTNFDCMREGLVGPLLLAFSNDEPGTAAKVIRDFSKENEKLIVKLVAIEGKLLEVGDINRLANMPSLLESRSMFLSVLQAPITKLVRVLSEPEAKFVRLLATKRDQQHAA